MYVAFGSACGEHNSETPMTQARIDAQNRRVARVGSHFEKGNADMAAIVNGMTPPTPSGTCQDLTNSNSMFAAQRMAAPLPPGVLPGGGASNVGSGNGSGSPGGFKLPGASFWFKPGGGSSYPWGPLQNAAGRLVPPWACQPTTLADKLDTFAHSPAAWVLGGLAVAGLLFAGSNRKGRAA
jgi:hypothetical protein